MFFNFFLHVKLFSLKHTLQDLLSLYKKHTPTHTSCSMRNIKINCFKALKSPTSSPASLDLRLFLKNRSWLSHQSKAMKMVISVSTRLHLVFNFGMEAMKIETLVVHVCKSPFLATSTRTPSKIMCLCWKTMKMLIDDDQEMKTMSVLDLYFWENVMET